MVCLSSMCTTELNTDLILSYTTLLNSSSSSSSRPIALCTENSLPSMMCIVLIHYTT